MAQLPSFALDFERPLLDLERKIEELKTLSGSGATDFGQEIARLEKKARRLQSEIFSDLSRWQVTQLSRHPARPYFLDYVEMLFTDFFELAGDRRFAEDASIVGGWARLDGETVLVLGHQKGRNTKENMLRNFGMPRPEGYRKALTADAARRALRQAHPHLRRHARGLPRHRRRGDEDRPRPSPSTWRPWPASPSPSSAPSSVRVVRGAPWPSPWPTAC